MKCITSCKKLNIILLVDIQFESKRLASLRRRLQGWPRLSSKYDIARVIVSTIIIYVSLADSQ